MMYVNPAARTGWANCSWDVQRTEEMLLFFASKYNLVFKLDKWSRAVISYTR